MPCSNQGLPSPAHQGAPLVSQLGTEVDEQRAPPPLGALAEVWGLGNGLAHTEEAAGGQ